MIVFSAGASKVNTETWRLVMFRVCSVGDLSERVMLVVLLADRVIDTGHGHFSVLTNKQILHRSGNTKLEN